VTVTVVSRTTLAGPLDVRVPMQVVVSKKVRVRVRGKLVTRTKKVKVMRMHTVQACAPATMCDLVSLSIVFQPGGSEGWHSHPGVVLVGVKTGTMTIYDVDCSKTTVGAGSAFVMMGPKHVRLVRNDGTVPVDVTVTYVFPAGLATTAWRIDQPAPPGCPQG
jgi:hypothetical protein